MAGFEPRFPISYPAPDAPFQEAVRRAEGKLRIGFAPDLGGFGPVDTEMTDHLSGAMKQLERSGATVEEACPDVTGLDRTYHILRGISWVTGARTIDPAVRQQFKPALEENTRFGESLTIQDVAEAQVGRMAIFNAMQAFFVTAPLLPR